MGKQLDIFKQHEISSFKQRYNNFYAGVKERHIRERKEAEKDKTMTISIKRGVIPLVEMLNITPK